MLRIERMEERIALSVDFGVGLGAFWHVADEAAVHRNPGRVVTQASSYELYSLDAVAMRAKLAKAPMEFTALGFNSPVVISLPTPDQTLSRFAIVEAPIMAPELAAKYPQIKTYRGQGIDDPTATVRLDFTPQGFHAQVLSSVGAYNIDPYYHLDTRAYMSYYHRDLQAPGTDEHGSEGDDCGCGEDDHDDCTGCEVVTNTAGQIVIDDTGGTEQLTSGDQLFTYSLAVAATGEYTQFHGGTKALGQAAIVTAINRVTGIYEVDLTIRMVLVANNDQLVYTNGGTDPYTNNNGGAMLGQNQSNIDSVIGSANYDIGHVFSTGGGGIAALGVVGKGGQKAQGVTGLPQPIGDAFYVDYVSHEMGHQFGANHTFNGTGCGGGRNGSTAYEIGSGSTIMSYAGICGSDNLQAHSDPYFHFISHQEIRNYVSAGPGNTSATKTNTGNAIPTVEAGINYTIPDQTPFMLTAVGSDANGGQVLTYNWEERDLGPAQTATATDNGTSPLFRSWLATTSPTRVFPRMTDVLDGTPVKGEKYAMTNRSLKFRVTVRDNASGGGGVGFDDMTVTVVNSGAGFLVTSQNSAANWTGLTSKTITWDVAGTNSGAINTPNVDIYLSTNGGASFSTVLATGVSNDGSHTIVVPNIATNNGRIMVKGSGNIFFDTNNANIKIVEVPTVPAFESGMVVRVKDAWRTVNLSQSYTNPVIVVSPVTYRTIGPGWQSSIDPSMVRVRNVTSNSFQVQVDEWDYLDGTHLAGENLSYFVIEAGTHTLSDGTVLVAGTQSLTDDWTTINFGTTLGNTPAVVSTVITTNDGAAVTTRTRNVTTTSFDLRLQEQQAADGDHGAETVHYLAMETGNGTSDGITYISGRTGTAVTDAIFNQSFSPSFADVPVFLASVQTFNDADPLSIRTTLVRQNSARFFLQEETSFEPDTTHSAEIVGFIALTTTTAARGMADDAGAFISVRSDWLRPLGWQNVHQARDEFFQNLARGAQIEPLPVSLPRLAQREVASPVQTLDAALRQRSHAAADDLALVVTNKDRAAPRDLASMEGTRLGGKLSKLPAAL
jgi:hypothetical protein